MFEKILEYQKLDGRMLALKREADKDPARQNLNKVVALVKNYQNQLLELDSSAKVAIADYEKCKMEYDNVFEDLNKMSKTDLSSLSEEELNTQLEIINSTAIKLANLERGLSLQAGNVDNILKNFEHCKKSIVSYKQKYIESKNQCEAMNNKINPQIEEIKKQMAKMEESIDAKVLARYKHLRQDKIFPVFVPLNSNSCGGCSMGIPSALMNKLKENKFLECEQCRRYIYLE